MEMRFPMVSFSASGCHGNLLRSTWMTPFMMRKTYKMAGITVNEEAISNNLCTSLLRLTVIMSFKMVRITITVAISDAE